MVVNNSVLIAELMRLGLSEYETKAYLTLLEESPGTAYEVGKASGIPTSKIYEVLKKLLEKEMVSVFEEGRARRYIPLAADEYLNRHKQMTEAIVDSLRIKLARTKGPHGASHIWNITDHDYLMHKVKKSVKGALRTILLSIWSPEMEIIEHELQEAVKRGVNVVVVHFGTPKVKIGQIYPHPVEDTIYDEKGGRGFVIVIDSREILTGTIFNNRRTEGAWSMNRGFVILGEDYIKHDIYIMKIVKRFDRTLKQTFGVKYAKLRDIFTD
jgi:sugar-specific transcriptional regulator TrmB